MYFGFKGCGVLLFLFSGIVAILTGVISFLYGFLLTRNVILKNSTCSDFGLSNNGDCWMDKTFERAIILLIDGLHYEFASPTETPEFHKMIVFDEIIKNIYSRNRSYSAVCSDCHLWRGAAFLSRFIADPPTTTMQRLKGLVSGTLPTFIDVAQNFDSPRISEDNFIWQLENMKRRVVLLGDDTWGNLFPDSFSRSYMFPSFNVWDLHTVDEGILQHLDQELNHSDTNLLIAHFLGVDHAGHRFGRHNQHMRAKLQQLDHVVRRVARSIDDKTILIVIGDHGMTASGDHGGDSEDEVTSALFVYSPGLRGDQFWPRVVHQVALVPTLCLLLGAPIPYSSLGSVVHQLFEFPHKQLQALELNVNQVSRFLEDYKKFGNVFSDNMWAQLSHLKLQVDSFDRTYSANETFSSKVRLYHQYLMTAKSMCEEVWATFDVNEMLGSVVLIIVVSVILAVDILLISRGSENTLQFSFELIIYCFIFFVARFFKFILYNAFLCYIPLLFIICLLVYKVKKFNGLSVLNANGDVFPIMLFIVLCLGNFSNSFLVYENIVVAFALCSLFAYEAGRIIFEHKFRNLFCKKSHSNFVPNKANVYFALTLSLLGCSAVRFSQNFYRCREEQTNCLDTNYCLPLSSIEISSQNWRYLFAVIVVFCIVVLHRFYLSNYGNLKGNRPSVLVVRFFPAFCGIFLSSYWALEAKHSNGPSVYYTNLSARVVFAIVLTGLLIIIVRPLMVFLQDSTLFSVESDKRQHIITEVFQKLRASYKKECPPIAYGLTTSLSTAIFSVAVLLLLAQAAVLGVILVFSQLLIVIVAVCWVLLHAFQAGADFRLDEALCLYWIHPVFWFILSWHSFYALAHQTTFSSIPWSAAFVGFLDETGGSSAYN